MKDIVVVGGGGHARVIISLIKKLPQYRLLGYTAIEQGTELLSAPYLGDDSMLEPLLRKQSSCSVALGIGNVLISDQRLKIAAQLANMGFDLPVLISPAATVNEDVCIGNGTVVFDGVVIATGARIGKACILNTGCTVDHDCLVDDGVHLGPGSVLSGGVQVGNLALIGAGAVVIQNRKVAERCLVGAGATVTTNLDEAGVYVGTPARLMR